MFYLDLFRLLLLNSIISSGSPRNGEELKYLKMLIVRQTSFNKFLRLVVVVDGCCTLHRTTFARKEFELKLENLFNGFLLQILQPGLKKPAKISFFQLKKLDCRKHAPNIPNA